MHEEMFSLFEGGRGVGPPARFASTQKCSTAHLSYLRLPKLPNNRTGLRAVTLNFEFRL